MDDVHCPRCGSDRVIPDARLVEQDYGAAHTVRVGEFASPDDAFFRWESKVDVRAHVCGDCGYIELFAADPERLYEAYQRARNAKS
jgi:ribosomal protein S27AE